MKARIKFDSLSDKEKSEFKKRFRIPDNTTNVVVIKGFPYISDGYLMGCTVKPEKLICGGFHTHGEKR